MPLNVAAIYGIANHFRSQHLSKLQFPGSNKSTQTAAPKKQAAPKPSGPQRGGDAHFNQVMARSAGLLDRTAPHRAAVRRVGEDHRSNLDAWHAEHSRAASDLLHTFNSRMNEAQAQTKPSTSGGWAAYNDTFGPHAKPSTPTPTPAAPAPSTPATPRKTMADFESAEAAHLTSLRAAKKQAAPTPVKSEAQFQQQKPKKEDYRQAAGPAPRLARTYHAPEPTPFTPPAGQPAPQHSPGGVGTGRQGVLPGMVRKATYAKGKAVAPRSEEVAPSLAGPGKGQLPLWDDKPATPAKRTQAKPRAPRAKKAAPSPSKPSVSDSDWNTMLNDSIAERNVRKAAAKPAPTASGSRSNVRETTLKKNGKEHVIRTEHNGTQKELEAKHTKAVKTFLGAAYAPDVKAAEDAVTWAPTQSGKTLHKRELREVKRKASGTSTPTHSESFREAYKPLPKVKYDTEVPEHLKPFMGDGTDDPGQSHYYGIGKK